MGLRLLSVNRDLRYIYIEGNPVARKDGYRPMLTSLLPHLRSIDHKTLPRSKVGASNRHHHDLTTTTTTSTCIITTTTTTIKIGASKRIAGPRPGSPIRPNGQGLRTGSPVKSTYNRSSTATSATRGRRGREGQGGARDVGSERSGGGNGGPSGKGARSAEQQAELRKVIAPPSFVGRLCSVFYVALPLPPCKFIPHTAPQLQKEADLARHQYHQQILKRRQEKADQIHAQQTKKGRKLEALARCVVGGG